MARINTDFRPEHQNRPINKVEAGKTIGAIALVTFGLAAIAGAICFFKLPPGTQHDIVSYALLGAGGGGVAATALIWGICAGCNRGDQDEYEIVDSDDNVINPFDSYDNNGTTITIAPEDQFKLTFPKLPGEDQ